MRNTLLKGCYTISLVALCLYPPSKKHFASFGPLFPDAAEEVGSADDPQARMNFETRLLVDPATGKIPSNVRRQELEYAQTLRSELNAMGKSALSQTWVHRGPFHVGGRTRAVALDVANENIVIAGSVSGGMWRSTDGGSTWVKTTDSSPGATGVAQDKRPGKTNIWYYCSGEPYGTSASGTGAFFLGNGIYKSTDNGVTWDTLNITYTSTPQTWDSPYDINWNIATDPHDLVNDVLYVATVSGIYKSMDGGSTFTTARGTFSGPSSYYTDVAVNDSGVVYATLSTTDDYGANNGLHHGIWRSADGVTWADISPSFMPDTASRMKIGINPSNQNEMYILAVTPSSGQNSTNYLGTPEQNSLWKYTYVSGDGTGLGGTWVDLSQNIPHNLGQFGNFNAQGGYDLVVKVKPDDPNTVFIGGTNIFRSTSAFTDSLNTTQIGGYGINTTYPDFDPYPNHHSDVHEFVFLPSNPNVMINAADGGLYKTTDCMASTVVWSQINTGYTTSQFYTVAVDKGTTGSNILIGGAQDNGSWWENSNSPTNTWTFSAKGDGSYCYVADGANVYYYSRQKGEIIKCTLDATGHATSFMRIDPIGGADYDFINPFTIDPNNNNIMYLAGGRRVWRNSDMSVIPFSNLYDSISTNWTSFPDTVTTAVSAIAVSKTPANRVYYGTTARKVYRVDNANTGSPTRTEITGITNPNTFPGSGNVNCIAVDPSNADNILVVFSNYSLQSLFHSMDGGLHWKKCGGNLEPSSGVGPSCRWASILPVSNGTIYMVATSTGLYGTTSIDTSNTTWVPMAEAEIGNTVCGYIDTRPSDGLVVVATHGHGIFSTYLTDVYQVGIEGVNLPKREAQLHSYPNPFVGNTRIAFTLFHESEATIELRDQQGKIVKTIASGKLSAGEHTFDIAGSGLSTGLYFVVAKTEERTFVTKIIHTK